MPIDEAVETKEAAQQSPPVPAAGPAARGRPGSMVGWLTRIKELNILIALLVLSAFLAIRSPVFLSTDNLLGVARAFSLTAIAAIGETMVIITGGIDLSVGSVIGLSGISTGLLLVAGWPLVPAVIAGLLVGTLFGLINGLLVTQIGVPPFIATLGTLSIGRGLVYIVTKGYPVTIPPEHKWLFFLGQGYVGPVPVPVIVMVVLTVLGTIFLSQSTMGRYVYAVGGNEEAARLAGINVGRVKLTVYAISGLLAAVSGMILVSRLVSAQPGAGLGNELPIIAAAVIGGTSLLGGEGTVLGAVLGAAIIGVIENGIVLLNINTYATQVVTGVVILVAVSLDIWQKRRMQRA